MLLAAGKEVKVVRVVQNVVHASGRAALLPQIDTVGLGSDFIAPEPRTGSRQTRHIGMRGPYGPDGLQQGRAFSRRLALASVRSACGEASIAWM